MGARRRNGVPKAAQRLTVGLYKHNGAGSHGVQAEQRAIECAVEWTSSPALFRHLAISF